MLLRQHRTPAAQKQVADQHLDTGPWASVQTAFDGVPQSSILDRAEINLEAWVCDGMHFLDEGQRGKGGVAIHHLVENATQTPDIRCPANLHDSNELQLQN